jgi:hypothetical protein
LAFILNVPLTVEAVPKLTPPAMSTSLKAIVPETVPVPAKLTFELPDVNVPLLVNEPLLAIVIVGVPEVDKVAPEFIVSELTEMDVETTGLYVVPDTTVTLVDALGTPPHQFAALDQSVEVPPIQEPDDTIAAVAAKRVELSQLFVVCEA